jgi:hypothetical protein
MNTTFPSSHTHYYIHITTHITTYTLLLPVALQPYLLQARVTYIHITTHTLLLTHTYIHITTYYVHIPTYTFLHTHYYIHITTYYVVVYINYVPPAIPAPSAGGARTPARYTYVYAGMC